MAFQPGLPGSQFPSEDALIRRIQDLERSMRELAAANPFAPMGIKPVVGGINITGDLAVTGTLSLPNGSVNNAALVSPVSIDQTSNGETNFALTTSDVARASTTIAIPAGYSRAYVFAVCNVGAINPTTASDFLYSSTLIQGVASREVFGYVAPSNGSVAVTTAKSSVLTGLSGGAITIAVNVHAGTAWAASATNRAYVEAQAIFLR